MATEDLDAFGPVAVGWTQVASTMERAAANYRAGRATAFERLAICITPILTYIVRHADPITSPRPAESVASV